VTSRIVVTIAGVTDAAGYTAEERQLIQDAARILDEHRDPRSPEQIKAEAEAEEYRQRIAESEERFRRDPEAQRRAAEDARTAAEARKREIEYRKAAARSDSRAAAMERFAQDPVHAGRQCSECRVPVYDGKEPAAGFTLCMTCWGRHALTCDECGRKGDLTRFCSDNQWRCDSCVPGFLARPFEPKAGRVGFPSTAGAR
jgi:hypothetical protein